MSGEWIEFYVTYDETEAGIIRDILESEEIQVVVNSSRVTPYPVAIGKMGEIKLLVKESDFEKAENALEIMKKGKEKAEDD